MKKRVGILVFLLALVALGWITSYYFSAKQKEREKILAFEIQRQLENRKKEEAAAQSIWARIGRLQTVEEWERVLKDEVPKLSGEEKTRVDALVRAKIFEGYFWRAEHFLARVRELLEKDERHPTAPVYREEAKKIYRKNENIVGALVEIPGDNLWNARLNYLRGVHYYRSLFFLNIQEEKSAAQDLVAQSVASLEKVFEYIPRDPDTEIAIEVLQKNAKALLDAGAGEGEKAQLQLLPSLRGQKEIGPFGIGGREQGRR